MQDALNADNLFHPYTYEDAVDLDEIEDPVERAGIEAQVSEFGQCPSQLFRNEAHPVRRSGVSSKWTSVDTLVSHVLILVF